MNLDKAIEILEKLGVKGSGWRLVDDWKACQLGVEALKFRQAEEKRTPYLAYAPLPGETTD